jgi:hypothetical protein
MRNCGIQYFTCVTDSVPFHYFQGLGSGEDRHIEAMMYDLTPGSSESVYHWHDSEKQDMQCTYICNIEACSHNYCCHGKAISIAYSECVSVALVIQHAMRMCCTILILCGLSGSTIFFHIISQTVQFLENSH